LEFRSALCLVRSDGSDPLVYVPPSGVSVSFPDWSPDGTRILTSGGTVIDVDDGEVRDVTTLPGRGRWSPDGRKIAIWSSGAGTSVVPLDGGAPVKSADGIVSDWGRPGGNRTRPSRGGC
jgi:Tol biopolymer transport system component